MRSRHRRMYLCVCLAFLAGVLLSGQSNSASSKLPRKSNPAGWRTGQIAITPQFEWAENFKDGLAAVRFGGKTGYIDNTGHFVINPRFIAANNFADGLAAVSIKAYGADKWGYIDKTGHFVINPQFDYASEMHFGFTWVVFAMGVSSALRYRCYQMRSA